MKNLALILSGFFLAIAISFIPGGKSGIETKTAWSEEILINSKINDMKLGAFSMSLSVKDLKASKQFYENLGFTVLGGKLENNYLIMKNENAIIGLFQGMFEDNILTFNPGWDENGQNINGFDDIRKIQAALKKSGVEIQNEIDPATSGPASFTITDPDGNLILFDQHR